MPDLTTPKTQIILLTLFSALFWFMVAGGTITALFVLRELQASPAQLSLTVTIGILVSLALDIPASAFADRYGRKPVLVFAVLFGLAGMIIAALSQNFLVFLASSVCVATYAALRQGVIEALLYDRIMSGGYKARYHFIMSRFGIYSLVFATMSPLTGGLLAAQLGVRPVFWLACIPMLLLLLLLCFIKEPQRNYERSTRKAHRHILHTIQQIRQTPPVAYYFGLNLALWVYATLFNSFHAMYLVTLDFSPSVLGVLASSIGFCVLLGHILFRNVRQARASLVGVLILVQVAAMIAPAPLVSVALFLVHAVFVGGLTAVLDREKQLSMPDQTRSTMLSVFSVSVQLVIIPLSLLFGWLANDSVKTAYLGVGTIFLCAVWVITLRKPKKLAQVAELQSTPQQA